MWRPSADQNITLPVAPALARRRDTPVSSECTQRPGVSPPDAVNATMRPLGDNATLGPSSPEPGGLTSKRTGNGAVGGASVKCITASATAPIVATRFQNATDTKK